jgi:hypothetical protein
VAFVQMGVCSFAYRDKEVVSVQWFSCAASVCLQVRKGRMYGWSKSGWTVEISPSMRSLPSITSHWPLATQDQKTTTIYICVRRFRHQYASQKQRHAPTDGQSYKYTVDWTEALSWTHYQSGIHSMRLKINYLTIAKALIQFQHKHPVPWDSPHDRTEPVYGQVQYAKQEILQTTHR